MPFVIRPMTLSDVDAVYQIDVQSFTLPWTKRSYQYEVTTNDNARAWVIEAILPDGMREIAGMMVLWLIVDEVHVATIAVHPAYTRRGLGRKLLAHGLLDAIEGGAQTAFLEVRRSNTAARAMYETFGFYVTSVREGYYHDNHEDALLMTLSPLERETLTSLLYKDVSRLNG